MRIILALLTSMSFLSPMAQTHLPVSRLDFSKYAGLSAGSVFFAGGTSFLSAPVGLQLTRPLNKNLYAFAGISAAPVFFSFSRLYTQPVLNPPYPGHNLPMGNAFGLNSRVEAGLMYINDAKTFSISGSIGVDRTSYPV